MFSLKQSPFTKGFQSVGYYQFIDLHNSCHFFLFFFYVFHVFVSTTVA